MPTTQQESSYLSARREWNERYGSYIAAAKRWFLVALLALVLASIGLAGVIWFAGQPRLIPYVVEVNGKGEPLAVYSAQRMTNPTTEQNVLRFLLGQFIADVRSVTPDTTVQKQRITRTYAFLASGEAAHQQIGQWFRSNNPIERSQSEIVAVEIDQILPVSEQTWRLEWTERTYARNGELKQEQAMTASIMIQTGGEVSEQNLLLNPTGLFITQVNWQRELSQKP